MTMLVASNAVARTLALSSFAPMLVALGLGVVGRWKSVAGRMLLVVEDGLSKGGAIVSVLLPFISVSVCGVAGVLVGCWLSLLFVVGCGCEGISRAGGWSSGVQSVHSASQKVDYT